jgi:hypothetical protein
MEILLIFVNFALIHFLLAVLEIKATGASIARVATFH